MKHLLLVGGFASLVAPASMAQAPSAAWTQWGGPTRDFMVASTGLANSWPASGPKRLWTRALGEGHSAILVEGGRLYTMYRPLGLLSAVRRSQEEVVTALDAASGQTIWEYRYASPTAGADFSQGAGPHATPLIVGNRLVAVGSRREFVALDKNTGKVLWSHDLIKDYGAPSVNRGMANSPLLYNNTILLPIGGKSQALGAFNPDTGVLVWKAGDVEYAPASPVLITVDGQNQVVLFGGDRIAGMDPSNGKTLWSHPHKTDYGLNISTPIWSPADHLLIFSSAYGTGSRALELRQSGGATTVVEKWALNRVRVHIGSIIRIGDMAYMSSGDFGPAFLSAVNVKTGAMAWQDRAFARAQLLYADNKLVVLDEDGVLGLATVSPQGLKVLARAQILEHLAWTPPTLVGRTLYVRDRQTIAAYDLS
ncbi:MAG: PQQ-like beta-propeller repeat protein [Acidobacteriota bacterium]|nr:PQQ-like beta-propeller repeat protein [Acidobacteriota bacterium]